MEGNKSFRGRAQGYTNKSQKLSGLITKPDHLVSHLQHVGTPGGQVWRVFRTFRQRVAVACLPCTARPARRLLLLLLL